MLVVWDTQAGRKDEGALPIKTVFDPHEGRGVRAAEFSGDGKWLVTLGNEEVQTLAIWDWTQESDKPVQSIVIEGEPQTWIKFNQDDPSQLISNGLHTVNFFSWEIGGSSSIQQLPPLLSSKDFKHTPTSFTTSIFIQTDQGQALSATADGDVIMWTDRSLNNLSVTLEAGRKAAVKFMRLHNSGINILTTIKNKYIVTGGEDGFVKIYDLQFRLLLWFERLRAGPITSISFLSGWVPDGDGAD
ncbi:Cilia- and flagella-associated protein 251, partial [Borealophlyctis nickersoniae]